jgi:hypothetical protein
MLPKYNHSACIRMAYKKLGLENNAVHSQAAMLVSQQDWSRTPIQYTLAYSDAQLQEQTDYIVLIPLVLI